MVRERKLVDLRAFYKISSKYDYFLVFLLFSSFCSHGYLQKKTWLPPFWLKLLPKLYGYSGQNSSIIHNLKCFVNWTVTELRVQAILSRIYYFAIFDDKLWLFFTENPLFGHNFWKKKPRTCNLSAVQNQLLRVPIQLEFGILGADGFDQTWFFFDFLIFLLFLFASFRLFSSFSRFLFPLAPCNVSPFWSFLWGPDYVRQREKFSDASNCWALITRVLPLVSIGPVIRVMRCWFFYQIHCANIPSF